MLLQHQSLTGDLGSRAEYSDIPDSLEAIEAGEFAMGMENVDGVSVLVEASPTPAVSP